MYMWMGKTKLTSPSTCWNRLTIFAEVVDSSISQISIPPLSKPRATRFSEIHWTLEIHIPLSILQK